MGGKKDIFEFTGKIFTLDDDTLKNKVEEYLTRKTQNPYKHIEKEWGIFEGLYDLSLQQIDELAKTVLSRMTIEQKINQMSGDVTAEDHIMQMLETKYNSEPYYAGEDLQNQIPAVKFTDGPTGVVIYSSTAFPVSIARGSTWDVELEEEVGNAIGIETRAQDANFFAGICVDIIRHPRWGRSQESYGEDTCLVGEMGTALIKGVQNHVMACAKHYAAKSMEDVGCKINIEMDERTLREIYLPQFKACVDAGVASIMTAYNCFRGNLCGHNSYLIRDILKNEWGFVGFVMSDFLFAISDTKEATIGGVDIEMPFGFFYGEDLVEIVKNDDINEDVIDEAVLRILRQKIRFAQVGEAGLYIKNKVACKEHTELAKKVALKSLVLLKNDGILPIDKNKITKIAIVGKLANTINIGDKKGSSEVTPPYVINPLEGIKNKLGSKVEIMYVDGSNLKDANEIATAADAIIGVFGLTYEDEGEFGGDRDSLCLHQEDIDLINSITKVNKKVIVCVEGGSAIIMDQWKDACAAIMMVWYPGMEGGNAIADVIFGDANPCGKLPITIPTLKTELPYFNKNVEQIEYEYYHGYHLADINNDAGFPFGFGLSYTTYKYENLRLNKNNSGENETIEVSIDVINIGNVAGEEIVQLYIGYVNSSILRHKKDLKSFGKLHLNPGEKNTLNLKINVNDLAYYDVENKIWVVEDIEYIAYVGSSSRKEDLMKCFFRIGLSNGV